MSFKYNEFKTQEEIDSFFGKICEQIRDVRNLDEYIIDWYKKDGIKIYGYFYKNSRMLICYGQIVTPEQIDQQSKPGIFAKLPSYGSSRKYIGLKDHLGNDVLVNAKTEQTVTAKTAMLLQFRRGKVNVFFLNYHLLR